MKKLIFLGSILGTMVGFLAACFLVATTSIWLVRQWEPAPWVVWAVGLGMMGAAVGVIWRWWRLPVERRFRFSMRGMLVGMTLFALWAGTAGTDMLRWGRRTALLADLLGHGVTVDYYYHWPREPLVDLSLRIFGYDLFQEVPGIEIRRDQGLAALLEHQDAFPDLEQVNFWSGWISDAGLARVEELNRFPELRFGVISGCMITDTGLERLAAWKRLEGLNLHNCAKITDAGLAHLKELPNLRDLTLLQENAGTMPVTDAGLAHVADLQQLQELWLARIPVTDAGLEHVSRLSQLRQLRITGISITDDGIAQLQGLKSLESLSLRNTKVTEEGINALCEELPDCLVSWDEGYFPALCQIRQIEIWRLEDEERLLATIKDVDRIAAIKEWLDRDSIPRRMDHTGRNRKWHDGRGGACLSVRFEGQNRRMQEIGLGNGVYSMWERHCSITNADEEELRALLRVDESDWNTGQAVH
jgi:hypothetical protein